MFGREQDSRGKKGSSPSGSLEQSVKEGTTNLTMKRRGLRSSGMVAREMVTAVKEKYPGAHRQLNSLRAREKS